MVVVGILRMETLFTGLAKWFNKLETCVHQLKTKITAVFEPKQKTKTEVKVTLPRANFGLNILFHFTIPLTLFRPGFENPYSGQGGAEKTPPWKIDLKVSDQKYFVHSQVYIY